MKMEREKRPAGREWREVPFPNVEQPRGVLARSAWVSGPITVISSLQVAEAPDGDGECVQWLVSISAGGKRPKAHHLRRALRAFGMWSVGAENDTHHPGNAVHFWLAVEPARRVACQCKTDEELIVDKDGYTWTNPKEGEGPCRGCEIAPLTGRACPLHGVAREA